MTAKLPAGQVYNVDLEGLERAIYLRPKADRVAENQKALEALTAAFHSMAHGAGFKGYAEPSPALYTRLASAITALFTDPGFCVTQVGFDQLAASRSLIEAIFKASAFCGSDHVFALVPDDTEETAGMGTANKYLLLYSLNSKLALDLEQILTRNPQETVGLWLSMLGHGQVMTEEGDTRRKMLLDIAPVFEDVELPESLISAFCSAYMHVSYSDAHNKHQPKRTFHSMMAKLLGKHVQVPAFGPLARKEKPTILLVFDWWRDYHAMYRCYAQSIMQLKEHFYLIGCARNSVTNEGARAMFDKWIGIEDEDLILGNVARQILAEAPDIIYYPSIGMSSMTIGMASLRLAPVQVMTYGHPATTNWPTIDYGLIEADIGVQSRFSEKLIPLPVNSVRFVPYADCAARHEPRAAPDTIKIAISAMQVKVGWPFIRALQEIQKRSKRRVEFHFYCAAYGVGLWSMGAEIRQQMDNTMVYEMMEYQKLMAGLAECDICLFSFPFGATNSAIDAMLLGIPFVALEGLEPHSRTDSTLIRRAGLPDSMITYTPAEYVNEVVRLVDDDDRRHRIAKAVRRVDVAERFFKPDGSGSFLEAFREIYDRHCVEQAA